MKLDAYMPDWKRQELKEANEANGFEMVRTYEDRSGVTRVQGAYFFTDMCFFTDPKHCKQSAH